MTRAARNSAALLAAVSLLALCGAAEPAAQLPARATPVTACLFSADGSTVIAARQDAVLVLSSPDATLQRTLKPSLQRVTALALNPDGTVLAVAGGVPGVSGRVVLLDWGNDRVLASGGDFGDLATAVAFSADGETLAATSADGTARVFAVGNRADRLEPLALLKGHAGAVLSVIFGDDGQLVVTAGADRSIKVWDAASGALRRTLSNHTGAVHCLARRPRALFRDGGEIGGPDARAPFRCASGGDDHTVRVWQPEIGRMVRIVRGHDGPTFCLAYAPDGRVLYSAGAEGVVRGIDADGDTIERQWVASREWVYALSVSRDGVHVATGDWAGTVKLWRVTAGEVQLAGSHPAAAADRSTPGGREHGLDLNDHRPGTPPMLGQEVSLVATRRGWDARSA